MLKQNKQYTDEDTYLHLVVTVGYFFFFMGLSKNGLLFSCSIFKILWFFSLSKLSLSYMINIAQTLKKKLEVMKNMTYTYM